MAVPTISSLIYTILRIPPTSSRLNDLVLKFKTAKLAALIKAPTDFAVRHADEVKLPLSVWKQRLAFPANVVICVATLEPLSPDEETIEDALMSSEWVGMATLRGPLPYSSYFLPESGQPVPQDPDGETFWHLCTVYTSPAHRQQGIARKLIDESVDAAQEQTRDLQARGEDKVRVRVRLFFDPSKPFLADMYQKLRFNEAGMCTGKEAFVANGDGSLVPDDTHSTEELKRKWEWRYGAVMERVVNL